VEALTSFLCEFTGTYKNHKLAMTNFYIMGINKVVLDFVRYCFYVILRKSIEKGLLGWMDDKCSIIEMVHIFLLRKKQVNTG